VSEVSTRLPRGPHADRPRADERVLRATGADLQNGWLARHGTLSLTETRLVFVPTVLDTILRARRREIPLTEVAEVERFPRRMGDIPRGGRRPRMFVRTSAVEYQLMVPDLDGWLDYLDVVYQRIEALKAYRPPIVREGRGANPLLEILG
jgi:hypothetical protein